MRGPISNQGVDETVPLVQQQSATSVSKQQRRGWFSLLDTLAVKSSYIPASRFKFVPLYGFIVVFFNEAEFYIRSPALMRGIEGIACLEYYEHRNNTELVKLGKNIPEYLCKGNRVQERVADLYGALYIIRMISAIVGSLIVLRYFAGGRRKPPMILHRANIVVSNVLTFIAYYGYPTIPVWFFCLTGATSLIGGNYDISVSFLFASYADIVPDATQRSNMVFVTTSLQYFAQFVCMPVTSRLMKLNGPESNTPEASYYVALACAILAFVVITFCMPETYWYGLEQQNKAETEGTDGIATPATADRESRTKPISTLESESSTSVAPRSNDTAHVKPIKSSKSLHELRKEFGHLRLFLLFIAMISSYTANRMIDWYGLLQFPSVKFHWNLSQTTYLIMLTALLSFLNFAFTLPFLNRLCKERFQTSAQRTTLIISTISGLIVSICSVLFGLPVITVPTFVVAAAVYSFGSAIATMVQNYTVAVSPTPAALSAVLSILSLAATGGKVCASILWPVLLKAGLEFRGGDEERGLSPLAGLPFFAAAVLFLCGISLIHLADWAGGYGKGYQRVSGDDAGE